LVDETMTTLSLPALICLERVLRTKDRWRHEATTAPRLIVKLVDVRRL